ncbi:hypothetical protein [Ectobacillus sp. sgz5001026]|uniref:hypothetical protein n=1 Tax=Ectobacillus sp. sgz5001026 TaxID=3242473 RepID=UPI0036D2124B
MKLYSSLQLFVKYANEQQFLEPLLPSQQCSVMLQYEQERYILQISKKGLSISEEEPSTPTLRIQTEQDLHSLIMGELPLQRLIRRQGIVYTGTLSILLLVESIFFICRQQDRKI